MSKRVKGKKMCPADYDDAEESDCDNYKDPDYLLQEPPSPKLSQDKGCAKYKKRLREKTKNSEATPNSTQGGQSSPVTPVPSERIFSIAGYIARDSSDVLEQ